MSANKLIRDQNLYIQNHNSNELVNLFRDTINKPELIVKGDTIRELEDRQILIYPQFPFQDFETRKYDINYFKKEMLWKLTGDPYDTSIEQHAKIWKSVKNSDGSFNSNYGQYWFGQQMGLFKAFNELVIDPQTRRACIPMLSTKHLGHGVSDTVCTGHISFRIRDGFLNMSVAMRSSDQVFGLGTDIPTFSVLQQIMLGMINTVHHFTSLGTMSITADSSHIYQRHFNMIETLLNNRECITSQLSFPEIGSAEAFKLAACKGKVDPTWGEFSKWLLEI